MFLRAGQMAEMDAIRNEVLGRSAIKIQSKYRSYSTRRSFILLQQSAIQIQAICRGNTLYPLHLIEMSFKLLGKHV